MGTPISSTHLADGLPDGTSVTATHPKISSVPGFLYQLGIWISDVFRQIM